MEQKIFTTSYTGKDIGELKPMLESLDAMLIDIRFVPVAMPIKWSRDYLQLLLKRRYKHVQMLGNRSDKENKFEIQNLELGIRTVLNFQCNLVLMCECAELQKCHRLIIMKSLRTKGFDVEEIEDWKMLMRR